MTDRKKPGVALWVTVVLVVVLPVLYVLTAPLSEMLVWHIVFGGWIGEDSRDAVIAVIRGFYFPIQWLAINGPEPINSTLTWYYDLWLHDYQL